MRKHVELRMFLRYLSGDVSLRGEIWESSVTKSQSADETILWKIDWVRTRPRETFRFKGWRWVSLQKKLSYDQWDSSKSVRVESQMLTEDCWWETSQYTRCYWEVSWGLGNNHWVLKHEGHLVSKYDLRKNHFEDKGCRSQKQTGWRNGMERAKVSNCFLYKVEKLGWQLKGKWGTE